MSDELNNANATPSDQPAPPSADVPAAPAASAADEEAVAPTFDTSRFAAVARNGYVWGTGRRKAAIARVRIRPGSGKFEVNKKHVDQFFCVERDQQDVRAPLSATQTADKVDVFVSVSGGGTTGQAGAILLGLARALKSYDASYEPVLRQQRLLTRDSRKVERKKYGQAGARRRFQFSKR